MFPSGTFSRGGNWSNSKLGQFAWDNRGAIAAAAKGFIKNRIATKVIAKTVQKQQKQGAVTKRIVDCLIRQHLITQTNVTPSTTGVFQLLNGMAPGDIDGTRDGDCIYMKSLSVRIALQADTSATDPSNEHRIFIVYDRQTNGAIFPLDQLLYDSTAGAIAMISARHPDFMKRFVVIYDRMYKTNSTPNTGATAGAGVAGLPLKVIKIHTKFSKQTQICQYNGGTAATVADITRGSLYLLILSRGVVGSIWAQSVLNYSQ